MWRDRWLRADRGKAFGSLVRVVVVGVDRDRQRTAPSIKRTRADLLE
jgi:hypothetical protein